MGIHNEDYYVHETLSLILEIESISRIGLWGNSSKSNRSCSVSARRALSGFRHALSD